MSQSKKPDAKGEKAVAWHCVRCLCTRWDKNEVPVKDRIDPKSVMDIYNRDGTVTCSCGDNMRKGEVTPEMMESAISGGLNVTNGDTDGASVFSFALPPDAFDGSRESSDKRYLTEDEIRRTVHFIRPLPGLPEEIANAVADKHLDNHSRQLRSVQLRPSKIQEMSKRLERRFHKSQIEPGKNVGALASSCIGEKNTQSSLSSFHQAGQAKVALLTGVPRLEELVNVTRDIRTPSMEVYLNLPPDKLRDLEYVKHTIQGLFEYKEMIDFVLDYDQQENREISDDEKAWYDFHRTFIGCEFEQCSQSVRIIYDVAALHGYHRTLTSLAQVIQSRYGNAFCVCSPDNFGIIDVYISTENLGSVDLIVKDIKNTRRRGNKKKEDVDGDDLVMLIDDENKEYYFVRDLVIPSLLYMQVGGIEGIKKCYYEENKDGTWMVTTKGSNLKAIISNPIVDSKRTTSNHLWDVYDCFGIEATKIFLRAEIYKLLSIASRHLDLLINSMTYSGKPVACTRYGIDRKQVGALAKVAFEQPFDNFFHSATIAEKEDGRGASAAIILGKAPDLGSHMGKLIDANTGEEISEEKLTYNFDQELNIALKEQYARDEAQRALKNAARAPAFGSPTANVMRPAPRLLGKSAPVEQPTGAPERKKSALNARLKPTAFVPSSSDYLQKNGQRSVSTVTRIIMPRQGDMNPAEAGELVQLGRPPKIVFHSSDGKVVEKSAPDFDEAY